MPPITEKQRSPSIIKSNVKENFPSTVVAAPITATNSGNSVNGNSTVTASSLPTLSTTSSTIATTNGMTVQTQQQQQQSLPLCDKSDNRVPEIIDFRDTFLQEIEIVKDQIKAHQQQKLQNSNHHHHHHHNHYNGFQNSHVIVSHMHNSTLTQDQEQNAVILASSDLDSLTAKRHICRCSASNEVQHNHEENNVQHVSNGRLRRHSSDTDDELVLKRAREDNFLTLSSSPSSPMSPSSTSSSSSLPSISASTKKLPSSTTKIIYSTTKQIRKVVYNTNSAKVRYLKNRSRKRKSPSPTATITTKSSASISSLLLPKQVQQQQRQKQLPSVELTNHSNNLKQSSENVITNSTATVSCNGTKTDIDSYTNKNSLSHNGYHSIEQEKKQHEKLLMNLSLNVQLDSKICLNEQKPLTPQAINSINLPPIIEQTEEKLTTNSVTITVPDSPSRRMAGGGVHKRDIVPDYMANDYIDDQDDDQLIGEIDDVDVYESTDDDDDEYRGCPYYLNSDDEQQQTDQNSLTEDETDHHHNHHNEANYLTPKQPFSPSLFPNVPPFINFSSHAEKGPPLPKEIQKFLKWKLTNVMPKIVRRVIVNSNFRLIKKANDWMGTWEKHMKSPCFKVIRSYQKFNHLPGTFKIGRKDSVWRNLNAYVSRHGRKEFGIMSKTFILPQDLDELKRSWPRYSRKNTKWIIKPPASARGTGIKVINRWSQIPKSTPLIVQKYIERPLLIEGNKFDLRLYVIITSINPLRIFMHTDGLARFASVQYSDKLDTLNDRCMHLTNYSINKLSSNYAQNEDINACQGHKWTLKSLWSYFKKRDINTKRLWATLRDLVVKTVIGGESTLNKMFKQNVSSKYNCYELFGFDVILDENLVPWLLEVNISPSLHSDSGLDQHVKGPLVQAVLNTALYQAPPRLPEHIEKQILSEYNLNGKKLCFDRRIFTSALTSDEVRKHNQFTNNSIVECREDYIDTILDDLTPDDVRCLIIAEDELARSSPLERIFPSSKSYKYLKFTEGPRYYNLLLDAWETKYEKDRSAGIHLLQQLCEQNYHLKVPANVSARNSEERIARLQRQLQEQQQGLANEASNGDNIVNDIKNSSITTTNLDDKQQDNDVDDIAINDDVGDNCDDDDDDNTQNSTATNDTISNSTNSVAISSGDDNVDNALLQLTTTATTPVSCSKEAAKKSAKTVCVVNGTKNSENHQLSNELRAIIVETQ